MRNRPVPLSEFKLPGVINASGSLFPEGSPREILRLRVLMKQLDVPARIDPMPGVTFRANRT